ADLAAIAETPPIADPPPPEPDFAPAPGLSPNAGPADQAFGEAPGMTPPAWPASDPTSQIQHQEHQDENQDQDSLPPIIDAPPLAPSEHTPAPAEDIESVAARRAQRQAAHRQRWERSMWTSGILTLVALNLMLIGWRSDVVRWLPQTASLYAAIGLPVNLRGLIFTGVTTEREAQSGVEVLVVQGTIVNTVKRPVEVPRLGF